MREKAVLCLMVFSLLLGMSFAFRIQPVKAGETIYIRADGSIDPPTAPIQRDGEVYTFTDNIYDEIVVERSNIIVDGNGYILQGSGSGSGFDLSYISNVTIKRTNIRDFSCGLNLYSSSYSVVSGNNLSDNVMQGNIRLDHSSNNTVFDNNLSGYSDYGIHMWYSHDNNFTGNHVSNNGYGILIRRSGGNVLRGNNMTGNSWNFGIDGRILFEFIQDIDASNLINGKPIYYWVNQKNGQVPTDAGYVAAINSTNITVRNMTLTRNVEGVLFAFTNGSTIEQMNISSNLNYGIWLRHSHENIIKSNLIRDHSYRGVLLQSSTNNIIMGNNITDNAYYGIKLEGSNGNNLTYNRIAEHIWYGIEVGSGNIIHHNVFVNNIGQVSVPVSGYVNTWDDGYPSGGNYWSDYTGTDSDGDGIGDTPYVIDTDNQDNYPLMRLVSPVLSDVNGDGIVDIFDVGYISAHWYPGPPIGPLDYDVYADINNDLAVDIFDIGIVSAHWGESW